MEEKALYESLFGAGQISPEELSRIQAQLEPLTARGSYGSSRKTKATKSRPKRDRKKQKAARKARKTTRKNKK